MKFISFAFCVRFREPVRERITRTISTMRSKGSELLTSWRNSKTRNFTRRTSPRCCRMQMVRWYERVNFNNSENQAWILSHAGMVDGESPLLSLADIDLKYVQENGFDAPFLFKSSEGLGMRFVQTIQFGTYLSYLAYINPWNS